MTDIELPRYEMILPNQLFRKRGKSANYFENIPSDDVDILLLQKFKVPTQEEVLQFIQKSASEIDLASLEESVSNGNLNTYLRTLPGAEIGRIAKGSKDSIDHLAKHFHNCDVPCGETYLDVANGTVPSQFIDDVSKSGKALEFSPTWSFGIQLSESGNLPDKQELEYLLARCVRDSDVLRIKGNFGDYQIAANQIRIVSNALNSPEIVAKTNDVSHGLLEDIACSNVQEVSSCLGIGNIMGGGLGIVLGSELGGLGDILQQVLENQEGQENPYSGGDPSLN